MEDKIHELTNGKGAIYYDGTYLAYIKSENENRLAWEEYLKLALPEE